MTYYRISYKRIRNYRNWTVKCDICIRVQNVEEYQYGVIECTKDKWKICRYVKVKCANYKGNYIINSLYCTSRYKISIKRNKKKLRK